METQVLMRDVLHLKIQLEDERRRRNQAEVRYAALQHEYTKLNGRDATPSDRLSNGDHEHAPLQHSMDAYRQENEVLCARIAVGQRIIFTLLEEIRLLKQDLDAVLSEADAQPNSIGGANTRQRGSTRTT